MALLLWDGSFHVISTAGPHLTISEFVKIWYIATYHYNKKCQILLFCPNYCCHLQNLINNHAQVALPVTGQTIKLLDGYFPVKNLIFFVFEIAAFLTLKFFN